MTSLTAGSEIDAWCTKCRMDLNHRIVAMVGEIPKRVVCLTCDSEHNYRVPKSAQKKTGTKKTAAKKKTTATQKAQQEVERINDWETRIAGQPNDAFTRYTIDKILSQDELVLHKKFGEGYVVEVLDGGKVTVMFRDGQKTLAHGMTV